MDKEYKTKNKIIAVILNIIAIGAGYLYVGKLKKSLLIYPLLVILSLAFYYTLTIYSTWYLVLLYYVIYLFVYLLTSYDIVKIISRKEDKSIKQNKKLFIVLFIIVFYLLKALILLFTPIKHYKVSSDSMTPTIIKNDYFIVMKSNKKILRGDIVVFMYPKNPKMYFVKRCVAKAGDSISLKNKKLFLLPKEGNEYVKKNYPKESIVRIKDKLWVVNPYKLKYKGIHNDENVTKNNMPKELLDIKPILILKDNFFVMGDNRDHSNDSRFWGTVPKKYIIGKVKSIFINWSDLSRSGMIVK